MQNSDLLPQFDLESVPFTTAGSWLAIAMLNEKQEAKVPGLHIRSVRNVFQHSPLWRIELLRDGAGVTFTARGYPHKMEMKTEAGEAVEIVFDGPDTLRFSVPPGMELRLHATDRVFQVTPAGHNVWRSFWRSDYCGPNYFHHITCIRGSVSANAVWNGMSTPGAWMSIRGEGALVESPMEWDGRPFERSISECASVNAAEFEAFAKGFLTNPEYRGKQIMAAYLNWSCFVEPAGHLKRRCLIVSKHKMAGMWAWDHCFNAIALARSQPRLAWDQFMVVLDHCNQQGALPDLITEFGRIQVFEKPPVHGWALSLMMKRNPGFFTAEILREAYDALEKWTNFWLVHRDPYHNGMPLYYHGNDSGWDNNTWFQAAMPMSSPELPAYLALQMDVLADLGDRLGFKHEWRSKSQEMLKLLVEKYWNGSEFQAVSPISGPIKQAGDSLLPFMTILLGKRLPSKIYESIKNGLLTPGRFLSEWGVASESMKSPLYQDAGYSRGPIWAPANMMAVMGLWDAGDKKEALQLARAYCKLCSKGGFAENFNARTGAPNNEKTLSWTASVFLILSEFVAENS